MVDFVKIWNGHLYLSSGISGSRRGHQGCAPRAVENPWISKMGCACVWGGHQPLVWLFCLRKTAWNERIFGNVSLHPLPRSSRSNFFLFMRFQKKIIGHVTGWHLHLERCFSKQKKNLALLSFPNPDLVWCLKNIWWVLTMQLPVADPGFPRYGAPTPKVGALTYYLANFFPENWMKMKEIGPTGDVRPWRPPPPPHRKTRHLS